MPKQMQTLISSETFSLRKQSMKAIPPPNGKSSSIQQQCLCTAKRPHANQAMSAVAFIAMNISYLLVFPKTVRIDYKPSP